MATDIVVDCDVVLVPTKAVGDAAIAASQNLSQFGSSFTLEYGKFYPHVSLYILRFQADSLGRIERVLCDVANKFQAMELRATDYVTSHGYVVVDYEILPQLRRLQEAIVSALNPLRDGMPASEQENMRGAEGAALDNFKRYGYKYVNDFFVPHITLARLAAERNVNDLHLPDAHVFDGQFSSIGLFALGPHSTCARKIFDLSLGSS